VLNSPPPEIAGEIPNVELFREHVLDAPAEAWTTAYAKVGGSLPLAELASAGPAVLWLQGAIDVSQAGPIAIEVSSTAAAQLWIDAEPFDNSARVERAFSAGKHTLTFRVQVSDPQAAELKVELSKPAGSAVQFVVINGM
jgi:hypothetical protein